jgi:hypothetical protein
MFRQFNKQVYVERTVCAYGFDDSFLSKRPLRDGAYV